MKSNDYWRKRSEEVAKLQFDKADEEISRLRLEYDRAIQTIGRDIEVFYQRYAKNNDIDLAEARKLLTGRELKEFKMSLEEFIDKAKNNADGKWTQQLNSVYFKTRISRLEALLTQIRNQAETITGRLQENTKSHLEDVYKDTYYRTLYEIQSGTGVGTNFARVDSKSLEKVLQTRWIGSNYSERIWNNRDKLVNELQTKLTQSFIRGDSVDRTAKDLAERMNVSYSSAARIIRTESSFIANQATWDGYKASGVVDRYEYLSTLDGRTSETCRSMDGEVFKLSEKEVGINYPPLHAHCRSTVVPYFDDMDPGERIARDENGKTYYVTDKMTYKDWLEKIQKDDGIILKSTYNDSYRKKLLDTYKYFQKEGFIVTEHALNRIIGRIQQGRLPELETILETMRGGKTYTEPDGTIVKFGNALSVHFASDNLNVKSVVPAKKPKKDWREVDETN